MELRYGNDMLTVGENDGKRITSWRMYAGVRDSRIYGSRMRREAKAKTYVDASRI